MDQRRPRQVELARPATRQTLTTTTPCITETVAQEGLVLVEENMVAANLVHRDFENEIRNFGDVVNTRRPGEFKIKRKENGAIMIQRANATNVRVPLDQWFYNTFIIRDGQTRNSLRGFVDTQHIEHCDSDSRALCISHISRGKRPSPWQRTRHRNVVRAVQKCITSCSSIDDPKLLAGVAMLDEQPSSDAADVLLLRFWQVAKCRRTPYTTTRVSGA